MNVELNKSIHMKLLFLLSNVQKMLSDFESVMKYSHTSQFVHFLVGGLPRPRVTRFFELSGSGDGVRRGDLR